MVGYHYFLGPCCHRKDGGSRALQSTGILLQNYTSSQTRRLKFNLHCCEDFKSYFSHICSNTLSLSS